MIPITGTCCEAGIHPLVILKIAGFGLLIFMGLMQRSLTSMGVLPLHQRLGRADLGAECASVNSGSLLRGVGHQ